MGNMHAVELSRAVIEDMLGLDQALRYHLFNNHFPPLPHGTLELAKQAISLWNEGKFDEKIDVSSIGEHRVHGTSVPVQVCLESWHLWPFVDQSEE